MSLDSAIDHLLAAKRITAPSQSYRKDNPGEYAKVVAYLEGGARPSGVVTAMGLGLLEVEDVRRGATPPPPPPPPPPGAYFVEDFNDPSFAAWLKEPSGAVPSQANLVSNGEGGNAARLVVTPTSSGPNASSELVSLFQGNNNADIHTQRGEETWYRVRMRFPSGKFFPTRGEWNWLVEWHNDGHTASYGSVSTGLGVATDYHQPSSPGDIGQNPRLWFRLQGGLSSQVISEAYKLSSNSLRYDHWYDIVFRFVWKTDQDGGGHIAWWVDGTKHLDKSFPILQRNPDGTHDHPAFGLYNYRLHDPAHTSEVHFDSVLIGPSAASVGFNG